jgi:hypothetical protein
MKPHSPPALLEPSKEVIKSSEEEMLRLLILDKEIEAHSVAAVVFAEETKTMFSKVWPFGQSKLACSRTPGLGRNLPRTCHFQVQRSRQIPPQT